MAVNPPIIRRRRPLYIICMDGLGDGIYHRPFVKMVARRYDLWLRTPWPELYADFGIRFVRSPIQLRTQQKNIERQNSQLWGRPPRGCGTLQIRYKRHDLLTMNVIKSLERQYPAANGSYQMDLPNFGPSPVTTARPIALVRPATLRREWLAPSRNPRPEYIQEAIDILIARGFCVVSVADCDGTAEWFEGKEPGGMTFKFHQGELNVDRLLALVQHSAVVVGGPGWILPAALAAQTPLFVIFGGRGGHNSPDKLFDPRMNLSKVGWLMPEPFCRCVEAHHVCNKTIPRFGERFEQWLTSLNLAPSTRDGLLPAECLSVGAL
jgi:hypothetical protein